MILRVGGFLPYLAIVNLPEPALDFVLAQQDFAGEVAPEKLRFQPDSAALRAPQVASVLVSAKIGTVHLGRDAYVNVRQSMWTQLREHTESLIRQYELRERAVALGWDAHQARVIDADLGRRGGGDGSGGFRDLVRSRNSLRSDPLRLVIGGLLRG